MIIRRAASRKKHNNPWRFLSFAIAFAGMTALQAAVPDNGTIAPNSTAAVVWDGNLTGQPPAVGLAQEGTCVDGSNCDVFTLTVSGKPTDWAGKTVLINLTWGLQASDYDFYVHKDSLSGPLVASGSNTGPADPHPTSDSASINPATSGTGKYIIHVLYAATVPTDQYHGTVSMLAAAGPAKARTATYISGGITFSPNVELKSPANLTDAEPSNRTDIQGNSYIGGIRGFPAGVDLWYYDLRATINGSPNPTYDPNMRIPAYRGQPDGFSPASAADLGGDGGGDIDLAVGFSLPANQAVPTLAFSSLIVANISTGNSVDLAKTYNRNQAGNVTGGAPADDRQWHEFLGGSSVYMLYRTAAPAVTQIQRSDDGGLTYGPASTAGAIGQVGSLDVHQKDGVVYGAGSQGIVVVGTPSVAGVAPTTADYVTHQAATDPNGVAHLFFVTKVADDTTTNGTLYVCYSNDTDIFLKHSNDKGATWSDPVKVSGGISTKKNIVPWMETGPLTGSVGIAWYGTNNPTNDDNAEWKVYFAQSFDATSATPTFRVTEVTEPEHVIHAANFSENGLDPTGTGANRNLLDYFQVSFDPSGAAVIAYSDDHNDFSGNVFAAHQISGPSIKTGQPLPAPVEGSGLVLPPSTTTVVASDAFPPRQPGYNGEQVTDFDQDVTNAVLTRIHQPDPVDILSVRYDTSGTGASLAIAASFKVSDLSSIPSAASWRASFAVNSPHSVLSADGTYTYGASDHGDQFYVQASTSASGTQSFTYGKAVRLPDGTQTYTSLGTADKGNFNQDDNTVSFQVSVAKLNTALTAASRPLIQNGTVVTGLRGHSSSAASSIARGDDTLGGTQFVVHDSAFAPPAAGPNPTPLPLVGVAPGATPVPTPPNIDLANISTRVSVTGGQNTGVAGFIKRTGSTKRVLVRGVGPSLGSLGIGGALADPTIEVLDENGVSLGTNDNWRGPQEAEITSTGLAPTNDKEAALIVNLRGSNKTNNFTAVLKGAAGGQGIGVVEVFDLDAASFADLGNVSTRGNVGMGDDVLIGGLIVRDSSARNQSQTIVLRGIGPSLTSAGISGPLQNPLIELHDSQGNTLEVNDDWATGPQAGAIPPTLKPASPKESVILRALSPGGYTVVLRGADNGTGIGVVEAYNLGNQ
jgi:hypothetical protein